MPLLLPMDGDSPEVGWIEIADDIYSGFIRNKDGTFRAPAEQEVSTEPVDYPLNPAQFDVILTLMNVTVEDIGTAIDTAISDPVQNAFAKAKVRTATAYRRDNDLFAILGPIIGITDAQIDTAWMQAKDFY